MVAESHLRGHHPHDPPAPGGAGARDRAIRARDRAAVPDGAGGAHEAEKAERDRATGPQGREDPPCTRQSPLTLATFRSWGIHWMPPHGGAGDECTRPRAHSWTTLRDPGHGRLHRRRARQVPGAGPARWDDGDRRPTATRDRSHHSGAARGWPAPHGVRYAPVPLHGAREAPGHLEDSLGGRRRTLGKRVGCKPSGLESPILRHHPRNRNGSGGFLPRANTPVNREGSHARAADGHNQRGPSTWWVLGVPEVGAVPRTRHLDPAPGPGPPDSLLLTRGRRAGSGLGNAPGLLGPPHEEEGTPRPHDPHHHDRHHGHGRGTATGAWPAAPRWRWPLPA